MNEWTIVTTIVVIVGLIVTVTTPLLKLNTSITQLRSLIENVVKRVDDNEHDNTESHRRIWKHNDEQDACCKIMSCGYTIWRKERIMNIDYTTTSSQNCWC